MKARTQRNILCLFAAGVLGLTAACKHDDVTMDSPFPHAIHQEMEIECALCHAVDGTEVSYPTPEDCAGCHELVEDDPVGDLCAKCHELTEEFAESTTPIHHRAMPGYENPVPEAYAELAFDHDPFVDDEAQCLGCHGIMADEELKQIVLPSMDRSIEFYTNAGQPEPACAACHSVYDRDAQPPSHQAGQWMREHGLSADFEGTDTCVRCHAENTCTSCHEQMQPQNHNALFRLKTHGLEAEWGREQCATCHREDFCQRCHAEVQPQSHTAGWGTPVQNHCLGCHVETGERSGCYACHQQNLVNETHVLSAPLPSDPRFAPAHFAGSPCLVCHDPVSGTTGPLLRHPVTEQEQCGACHRF